MIARMAGALLSRTYNRYVLASLAALAVDAGLFLLCLMAGLPPVAASALCYGVGMLAHWLFSTRFVFDGAMASAGSDRRARKMLFIVTGLLGVFITMSVVGVGHWLGQDPRLGKLAAIAISFQATYMARRMLVFAA